jgi:hypothetical protein
MCELTRNAPVIPNNYNVLLATLDGCWHSSQTIASFFAISVRPTLQRHDLVRALAKCHPA